MTVFRRNRGPSRYALVIILSSLALMSCSDNNGIALPTASGGEPAQPTSIASCEIIASNDEPKGLVPIQVEKFVTGLTVPWGIGFLSPTEFLVTERPGRVRFVRNGILTPEPVLNLESVAVRREGGLLGVAIHPQVEANGFFYLYYTAETRDGEVNRVERFKLSPDRSSAVSDRIIIDNIPAGVFHDGGRLKFGPDGQLYVGTGDGREPARSQNLESLAGKVLRVDADGGIPAGNPFPNSPVYLLGVRNVQAFDWLDASNLVVADHGPTGELGRSGHDELSIAKGGENLGWPNTWRCEESEARLRPLLVWQQALPPGGLTIYNGSLVPEWKGSVMIATLGSRNLQRISLQKIGGEVSVAQREVYLDGQYGRLRDAVQAPDGSLYVTTSNCDGRGSCTSERDSILRITRR